MDRDVKQLVRRGYDRAAVSYLAARPAAGADVALLDEFVVHLPAGGAVLDAGCGAGQPVIWLGEPMYWSQFDAATNRGLLVSAGFALVWHRDVVDPMGHGSHPLRHGPGR